MAAVGIERDGVELHSTETAGDLCRGIFKVGEQRFKCAWFRLASIRSYYCDNKVMSVSYRWDSKARLDLLFSFVNLCRPCISLLGRLPDSLPDDNNTDRLNPLVARSEPCFYRPGCARPCFWQAIATSVDRFSFLVNRFSLAIIPARSSDHRKPSTTLSAALTGCVRWLPPEHGLHAPLQSTRRLLSRFFGQ